MFRPGQVHLGVLWKGRRPRRLDAETDLDLAGPVKRAGAKRVVAPVAAADDQRLPNVLPVADALVLDDEHWKRLASNRLDARVGELEEDVALARAQGSVGGFRGRQNFL